MCNVRRKIAVGTLLWLLWLLCVPLCIAQTDKALSGRDLLKALSGGDTEPGVSNNSAPERRNRKRVDESRPIASELLSHLRQFDAVYESGLTASAFSPGEAKNYRPMGSWGAGLPDRILPPIQKKWKLVMAGERCMLVIKSVEAPLSTFRPVALTDEESDAERGRPGVEAEDMTFWGPDYTAKFEVHRCYSRENEKVKVIGQGGGRVTFFLPDDTSRNRPLKQFLWSMGRGYSKYIYDLNSVVELEDRTIRCSGPGTDSPHDKDPARWELVVDPAADYMVRSAKFTELGDDKPAYEITTSGTKVMNGRIVPETATWQEWRDGRKQIPLRFVFQHITQEPDYKLLEATEKAMFGPYQVSTSVSDERVNPSWHHDFEPGQKYVTFRIIRQTLVGRTLEGLEKFGLKLDENQIKDKMILLGFWDFKQRPSRHFIKQLAGKAEELKQKDVIVVTVQFSKVENKVLNEWLTKNQIAFPVEGVKDDEEKIRQEWAIKSLPWLILADRNRTVIAEGFGLEELAGKIKESKGGEPAALGEAGLGRTAAVSAEGKQPTVSELLDRYAQTRDKIKSYIAKTKCTIAWDNLFTGRDRHLTGKGVEFELREFRTDGSRAYTSELTWGHRSDGKQLWREGAYYKSHMWDGRLYLAGKSADGDCFADHAKIFKGSYARDNGRDMVCKGDVLNDYEGLERMDHLLRKAMEDGGKVSVLGRREKVGRYSCYVVEAQMKDGPTYKLWLDPGHGYQITKTESREVGDGKRYPEGLIIYSSMQVLGFKKIDGLWVPMEVEIEAGRTTRGGDYFKRKIHVERTEFVLNPNHEALGSFVAKDVANGAEVNISGVDGIDGHIDYIWQDGKVVDAKGREVELINPGAKTNIPPVKPKNKSGAKKSN